MAMSSGLGLSLYEFSVAMFGLPIFQRLLAVMLKSDESKRARCSQRNLDVVSCESRYWGSTSRIAAVEFVPTPSRSELTEFACLETKSGALI